jgi:outer membrane receptor protein involved in Fe transport
LCRDNPTACKGWTNTAANATQSYSAALGNVDARGFETALSYRPYELIKLDVAHTLTWNVWDTYYSTTGSGSATRTLVMHGNTLQNSSKHHVNGRITLYPLPGWSIELESDYISRYNTNQLDNNAYQRPMLFNLRSSYKWKNWTLSLQGMNILDTKYASRVTTNATGSVASYNTLAGVGDGPFSLRAGLQYKF